MAEHQPGVFERRLAILGGVFTAISIIATFTVYLARIDPQMSQLHASYLDLRQAQVQQELHFEDEQRAQNERVDRIELSRQDGLQRLARAEEAIASVKDYLAKIDSKMDRLLSRTR